ncbi:unnamed protein product, partial [Brachionus calyciflorus]
MDEDEYESLPPNA